MSVETIPEIQYYWDSHDTEEDLMGESDAHRVLTRYLAEVIRQYYRPEPCFVAENLGIHRTRDPMDKPAVPDISVFPGVDRSKLPERLRSWSLALPDRPAPAVVFEIASDRTWEADIEEKPGIYARMGVKEYFFYDPLRESRRRLQLRGWAPVGMQPQELLRDSEGRLWSEVLQSYLVPDGVMLRLTDSNAGVRLTEAEIAALAAEQERRSADQERRTREAAERERDAAAEELIRLRARLRELGIDLEPGS